MKVKCPNCGFEDEGKFCSHCGSPLPQLSDSTLSSQSETEEILSSFDKCPVCKQIKLYPVEEKVAFGLFVESGKDQVCELWICFRKEEGQISTN